MTTVPSTSSTTATTAADSVSSGRTRLAQNFDMFLTLLTTQMKNQDPMSPMDSTQFTQQLVQMTGVEQQLAANDLLKQLVANTGTSVSSAVGLIGKEVRAATGEAKLADGKANWTYNLPADATNIKFEILNADGNTIDASVGKTADATSGDHTFTWDGRSASGAKMPDGTYTLRITATTSQGDTVSATTYVQGLVSGIEQSDGQAVITVGGIKVPVSQVVSVTEPPAASNSNTASSSSSSSDANTSNPTDQTSGAAA
jgi:flagellar basal-body rod modification protein FlgD